MQHHTGGTLLYLETIALFIFSLVLGVAMLLIRDLLFGQDCSNCGSDKHIDFEKKIQEEERENLEKIIKK